MASQKSLDALETIRASLTDIQENHIGPLLANLDSAKHPRVQAQAQAALALTMGTLRFMGARLRGIEKLDPQLRTELNHMRKLLVKVQKKQESKSRASTQESKASSTTLKRPQESSVSSKVDTKMEAREQGDGNAPKRAKVESSKSTKKP